MLMYYKKIKVRISQCAECFETLWGLFSAKFKATANELRQERTQLRYYQDILLTGNCHKICENRLIIKAVATKIVKLKMKYKIIFK